MCNERGRFLMNEEELDRLGRVMAGILRHFPERFNLDMDSQGFIELEDFTGAIRRRYRQFKWLRPHHIIAIAGTDPKGRYQVEDERVRATYGHSLELELGLPTDNIPGKLYYPTTPDEVELLLEAGLKPSDRKMVHLSLSLKDAQIAGMYRAPDPIILEIDAHGMIDSGLEIMKAGTTVFLTREVPDGHIRRMEEDEVGQMPELPEGARLPKYMQEQKEIQDDQPQEGDEVGDEESGSGDDSSDISMEGEEGAEITAPAEPTEGTDEGNENSEDNVSDPEDIQTEEPPQESPAEETPTEDVPVTSPDDGNGSTPEEEKPSEEPVQDEKKE